MKFERDERRFDFHDILFQFGAVDDHLVNLLFLFTQNAVDHIAVQLALLIQLPHLLGLGKGRRGRLPLNGNGNILLVLGADERNLYGGGKGKLLLVHHLLQIRDKLGQADIPLHLFVVHAVALPDDLRGAFSCVPIILAGAGSLVLNGLHLLFQRSGLFRGQNSLPVSQVIVRHGEDGLVIGHVAAIQGILANPANSLARWRRCPAMISYPPPSRGRTSAG